jgi:hypothetical protein
MRENNIDELLDITPKLKGRYDDARYIYVMSAAGNEVSIRIGNQTPVFVDAVDFLRLVSHVVLDIVYGPSPTDIANEARRS